MPIEQIVSLAFAVGLLGLVVWFIVKNPNPSAAQYTVFRILLALGGACVAVFLSGFLSVELSIGIKASGALAVFVVIYFFAPAALKSVTQAGQSGQNGPDVFYPPANATTFKAVIEGLAQTDMAAATFSDFTGPELGLPVKSIPIKASNLQAALLAVGKLTTPQLNYTAEKKDGFYEIKRTP